MAINVPLHIHFLNISLSFSVYANLNNVSSMLLVYIFDNAFILFCRKLFRLVHNKTSGMWDNREINMCGSDPPMCTPPLSNSYVVPHIMSFGEDEYGRA